MLKDYTPSLGCYEGLTPFHAWVAEHADDLADETTGSTEWSQYIWLIKCPHILPNRRRAFLVGVDDFGFWYVEEWNGPNAENYAGAQFDRCQHDYDIWEMEGEDAEDESGFVGQIVSDSTAPGVAWYVDSCIYVQGRPEYFGHMVGDDRTFGLDPDNLTILGEDEYCPGCGQTGCHAHH